MRVLVVTPTYNEADNLERFVESLFEARPDAHVLVVDDNSPDGTGRVADQLAGRDERVHVLHRSGKLGIGSAYIEGFRRGMRDGYDVLVQMDTDLSHDPRYLEAFLDAIADGAGVVRKPACEQRRARLGGLRRGLYRGAGRSDGDQGDGGDRLRHHGPCAAQLRGSRAERHGSGGVRCGDRLVPGGAS